MSWSPCSRGWPTGSQRRYRPEGWRASIPHEPKFLQSPPTVSPRGETLPKAIGGAEQNVSLRQTRRRQERGHSCPPLPQAHPVADRNVRAPACGFAEGLQQNGAWILRKSINDRHL